LLGALAGAFVLVVCVVCTDFEPSGISVVLTFEALVVDSPVSSCLVVCVLVVVTDLGSGFLPQPVTNSAATEKPSAIEIEVLIMLRTLCNNGPAQDRPRRA
jgi:hypothetical protein